RAIDDFLFLEKKCVRAGGTGIDDGGCARNESQISGNTQRLEMNARLRCKPVQRSAAVADVVVDVDQPRNDEQSLHINNFLGLSWGNVLCCGSVLPCLDVNFEDGFQFVGGIHNVPALDNEIV